MIAQSTGMDRWRHKGYKSSDIPRKRGLLGSWAAVSIVGLMILLAVSAAAQKTVLIVADGQEIGTRTFAGTVGGALEANKIVLLDSDEVVPSADTPLQSGMVVTVNRAFDVNICVDGEILPVRTRCLAVGELIKEKGIELGPEDEVATVRSVYRAFLDEQLALPGFHVYLSDPLKSQPVASVHFDMQFEKIDWTGIGTPDFDQQLSLTIAIELPATGGGLLVWNINRLDIEKMTDEQRKAHMAAHRNAAYHAYTVGNLVVHSGHQLHQIAKTKDVQATDRRITMQAHALPVDGQWVIYW